MKTTFAKFLKAHRVRRSMAKAVKYYDTRATTEPARQMQMKCKAMESYAFQYGEYLAGRLSQAGWDELNAHPQQYLGYKLTKDDCFLVTL